MATVPTDPADTAGARATPHARLDLVHFLPYRLSVLSNRVSGAIARMYSDRFGLGVTQWRVMAVLGQHPGLAATQVAQRTAMDKVAVSRAVGTLIQAGRVQRAAHVDDRRRSVLQLTAEGYRVHDEIAPLALAFEQRVFEGMDASERELLFRLLDRLDEREIRAEELL